MSIDKMKYIRVDTGMVERIFIFTPDISHDVFAEFNNMKPHQIVSAGFVKWNLECFGRSSSLNKSSKGIEDTRLLRRLFQHPEAE